jgi:hypothetical protein
MSLWGFSHTQTEKSKEEKEKNNAAVKAFADSLPNIEDWKKGLLQLKFYALCPNGKRIPVSSICEEYAQDPTGLLYRSFDDRLIVVIQAIHPDLSEPYWNQAFYLSTGESSGMSGTWLPFNGIIMKDNLSRKIYAASPRGGIEYRNRKNNEKLLYSTAWFSKSDFGAPTERTLPFWSESATLKEKMINEINNRYGRFLLPEGDYLEYKSRFNRFGTISYALASHSMGGSIFSSTYPSREKDPQYPYISYFFPRLNMSNEKNISIERIFAEELYRPSPLQPCFEEMAKTYPITKPNVINAYIESNKAISYMNAFRQEKIFAPGLSFVNIPMPSLGYSMPSETLWNILDGFVKQLWLEWKLGEKTIDQVNYIFEHPTDELKKIMKQYREHTVMPNEPEFKFDLNRSAFASKTKMLEYFGGKRSLTKCMRKRNKRNKTRR